VEPIPCEEAYLAQGLTRRDFLKVAGAGAAGMALLGTAGCGRLARLPEDYLPKGGSRMNVVVVIIDSLEKGPRRGLRQRMDKDPDPGRSG
jgi:hypothetical protein